MQHRAVTVLHLSLSELPAHADAQLVLAHPDSRGLGGSEQEIGVGTLEIIVECVGVGHVDGAVFVPLIACAD